MSMYLLDRSTNSSGGQHCYCDSGASPAAGGGVRVISLGLVNMSGEWELHGNTAVNGRGGEAPSLFPPVR